MSESSERSSDQPMSDAERLAAANAAAAEQLELKLPGESSAPKDIALWSGVLVLLTLIAFWPATDGGFLFRDNHAASNPQFLAPGALSRIWMQRFDSPEAYAQPVYQPVAFTAYWLEYQLGGHGAQGQPAPMAYHIAGLIFEAGAAIFLWLVLREIKLPGAWLCAGIFALHPLHTEAVSWIADQAVVLAGLLFFASVYAQLLFFVFIDRDVTERAAGQPGVDPAITWGLFAGSIVCLLLAMLADPSAVVLPIVLLLIIWWKRPVTLRDSSAMIGLFLIGAILWLKNIGLPSLAHAGSLMRMGFVPQLTAMGQAMFGAALKLIVPIGLSSFHNLLPASAGLVSLGIVIALGVVLYLRQDVIGKGTLVAIVSFALISMASVNWFDGSRLSAVTDSSGYLAMLPMLILLVGWVASRWFTMKSQGPQLAVGLSTVLLLTLAIPTWFRAHVYQTPITFWRDALKSRPDMTLAETSLADQLRLRAQQDMSDELKEAMDADFTESVDHAKAALRLDPQNASAQFTWARVLVARGDDHQALLHFQAATQAEPNSAQILNEYGSALVTLGRFREAVPKLNQSLLLDPSSFITHRLLGKAYLGLGNIDRAIQEEQIALNITASDVSSREILADAQSRSGKLKDAIESYARVLSDRTQQSRPSLWMAVAELKDRQGDYDLAVQYMTTAQTLVPKDAEIEAALKGEKDKQQRAAATRPTTRSASGPSVVQPTTGVRNQ